MSMHRRQFFKQSAFLGAIAGVTKVRTGRATAASDRITVGVLGAGARAQELIDRAVHIPGVEVNAVCDAYSGRARRARVRTGNRAQIHRDYREILAREDVDTVFIGTPDHWHRQMAIESLEAGKDIYIEKPMTFDVDEGLEIIDAVKRTGRILQVGSQGMSSQIERAARRFVEVGRLGQITLIRASYNRNTASGAWLYPIPPDANEDTVDWKGFLGPAPDRPFDLERFFRWRCYWDYSGGIATDLFVHLVTSIHFVMRATMPKTVLASGELHRWKDTHEVPDTINALLVYPEGFTVNLSSTFNNQSSSESGFEILGTEGSVLFRGDRLEFRPENVNEDNRWVVRSWEEELEQQYYSRPDVMEQESPWTRKPSLNLDVEVHEEQGLDPTYVHLEQFFESVRSRKQPQQDAVMGHRAASAAHMVNQSLRKKQAVEWDFERDRVKA